MECYNCGQQVPDESERCPNCGQRFAVAKKPARRGLLARLGCGASLLLLVLAGWGVSSSRTRTGFE